MSRSKAEGILVLIVLAISTSYLLMKLGSNDLGNFNIIALRFAIAFAVLAIVFHKRLAHIGRETFLVGALLGGIMFALLAMQVIGLATVSTACGSFLDSTTVIFVPIIEMFLQKRLPRREVAIGSAIVMLGIGLLTLTSSLYMSQGAVLFLLSAVFYAVHIIVVDRKAKQIDLLAAGTVEVGVAGLLGLACTLLFETPQLPHDAGQWGIVLALALVCSICGLALEPQVQQYTDPERFGIIHGISPVFSALWGVLFLGESLGVQGIIGAALVIVGTLCARKDPLDALKALAQTSIAKRAHSAVSALGDAVRAWGQTEQG